MRQLRMWRFFVVLLIVGAAIAANAGRAQAATLIVNSANDNNDGACNVSHCSLREAINAANAAPGADRIEFNIAPLGNTHVITIGGSQLPPLMGDVVIDGYTQAGASPNTLATGGLDTVLRIELRGSNPSTVPLGLHILGSHVWIQGLALDNFIAGIYKEDYQAEDTVVVGNFLGTSADGLSNAGGMYGVILDGGGMQIGGTSPADRNLISGNSSFGIGLARNFVDPLHLTIQGNLIGTTRSGDAPLANGTGIYLRREQISAADVLIVGGTGPGEGNVIAATAGNGIQPDHFSARTNVPGSRFEIAGNVIGTNWARTIALPNLGAGIATQSDEQVSIFENVIANNGGAGIAVIDVMATGLAGTTISRNTIVNNTGLGIDLGNDGRTLNDATDSDTGPNELLNFPVLTQARVDMTTLGLARVTATIQAEPNSTYTMELFDLGVSSRPPGADAEHFLFDRTITTDATGAATFVEFSPVSILPGESLVATLTNVARGYTSEISDPIVVTQAGPSISGQITRDGGVPLPGAAVVLAGSDSRLALTDVNGSYLLFDVPAGGSYTVTPQTTGYAYVPASQSLPNLTTNAVAGFLALAGPASYTVNVTHDAGDGWCSPAECTLREAIAEANEHPGADLIRFGIPGAGTHTIAIDSPLPDLSDDLIVDGYTQPGALPNTNVSGGLNTSLRIALVPAAVSVPATEGLTITGSRVTVRGLAIAGFGVGAIVLGYSGGQDVAFEGNFFGTTPDGTTAVPDSANGIVTAAPVGLTVGGATPAARNLISGHTGGAVITTTGSPQPTRVRILGNLIGTTVGGLSALPNMVGVMHVGGGVPAAADFLHIGGDTAAERNVISGNGVGMTIARSPGADPHDADRVIAGNFIGVAADGETALGNAYDGIAVCGRAQLTIRRNLIANNGGNGVSLCTTPTPDGYGVALSENEIYENAGLAIDLDSDGRTANDADDSDTGTNDLQNFPVLTGALESLHGVRVTGQLVSRPNASYRVELFTAGGSGSSVEGRNARKLVTGFLVSTDASGVATFTQDVAAEFLSSEAFVATATDKDRMMTSEVSDGVALALLPRFGASGTITLNGTPLPNVRVDLTGDRTGSVLSANDGTYALADLPQGGSYTLTPQLAGYLFTPAAATLANLAANATADFAARAELFTRFLPEGATGSFWETSIALLNASNVATTANVEFLLPDGRREMLPVALTGPGHAVIDPATLPALDGATFSTVITSLVPLVASRTMRWGEHRELGAHAEQALNEPRTSWYFAEGATGCFDLFYLLVNPGAAPADVEVTYVLRAPAAPLVRHYTVGPFARATIHGNTEDGLRAAEVSAHIVVTNGQPIVAERAMYSSCYGASWRGGHDAVASPEPARQWFFAEGATGGFFDLYLLIANFESRAAELEIEYLLTDGTRIIKPYVVPAGSRTTIDVAGEAPQLESAAVSAIVRSTNDVPVIAERSQWWPHGGWYEGHVSAGVTESGVEWQLAGAEVGGAHGVQGYLLIANTGGQAGTAQVRAVFADGTTAQLAQPVSLAAHSRTTLSLREVFPEANGRSFGLIVESLGAAPAPIVVELSSYNDTEDAGGRRFWGAGTNVIATRVR